ncbi:MAG: hemolysin family protein [Azospirillaceae bacterium]
MLVEIAVVLILIAINGALAMSELAVVSARPARLNRLAKQGVRGAAVAIALAENPGRFLSTVQIGITLVGVLSGAFSGATIGPRLSAILLAAGLPEAMAEPLGVGVVVVAITYLSLIVGELVPKQIALLAPESVASRIAPTMLLLSRMAAPLVWLLEHSGKIVLAMLGKSGRMSSRVSDEEVRAIIAEAELAGVIEPDESDMLEGVMRIADRSARGLMTPRPDVVSVKASDSRVRILAKFLESGHARLPLLDELTDRVVGILRLRDLLERGEAAFDLMGIVCEAPRVHDALSATKVIERLRSAPDHILLVFDEHGHFEGLITPMDILGAITGGFSEDVEDEPKVVARKDGSLLVAGWMPVDEFADRLGLELEEDRAFQTVAGLVLDRTAEIPEVGQTVEVGGWQIEVVDIDGHRIDKLLVRKA